MKALHLTLPCALMLGLFSPISANAQYTGPDTHTFVTIEHALREAKDDSQVSLKGYIKEKIGNEKYRFTDDTGEITVEIDDDLFHTLVSPTTMVEIHGEYEKSMLKDPEIEVKSIMVVPTTD